MEVFSTDYVKAKNVSQMIHGESKGRSDETLQSEMNRKFTRRELSKAGHQVLPPEKSVPSLPATQAKVLENYRLRKKLEAMPCSVPKSFSVAESRQER